MLSSRSTDSNTYLLRNYLANFKCAALTYELISSWTCKKKPDETFLEYIENENMLGKHDLFKNEISQKKWLKKNERKLNQNTYSNFDVTFFHELLPILSDGKIARPGTVLHKEKLENSGSVEILLHNIKEFRNNISHGFEEASNEAHLHKLKDDIHNCLEISGELFEVPPRKIADCIDLIDQIFARILTETYTYQDRIAFVINILINNCFKEMQRRNSMELSNCSYYDIELSTEISFQEKNKDVFLSSKLLSKMSEKFVLIKGPLGSGKSTLMRALYHSILNNTEDENGPVFEGVDRFQFPLFIECRYAKSNDIGDYLKQLFPQEFSMIPKHEIIDAIPNIKGLVFLIDGIDEADVKSKELIHNVMSISKNLRNVSCIVTGRVEAVNEFITNDLSFNKLDYDELSIEPIECLDQKLNFLKIYDVNNLNSDKLNLQLYLKEMKPSIQSLFSSPVLLIIFYKIYLKNNDISNLKNERSLYNAIYLNYLEEIKRKLKDSGIANPKSTAFDLINVVNDCSFELLSRNRYFVNTTDYLQLVSNCKVKTTENVDMENILTCILSPGNASDLKNMNYYFEHSSIHEYLAVKWVHRNISETFKRQKVDENQKNLEKFLGCLSLEVDDPQLRQKMKRYKFIIKLLIFEILADDNLLKFQEIIVKICHEYIGPDQQFYLELMSATNCDKDVIQTVARIAPLFESFRITRAFHLKLIAKILPHAKSLKKIAISLYKYDKKNYRIFMSRLANDVQKTLALEFIFSYRTFSPMKTNFYSDLNRMTYQLKQFKACVTKTYDLRIVVGKMKEDGHIDISTSTLKKLNLSIPMSSSIKFSLTIKYTKNVEHCPKNPAPENTFLRIKDGPENCLHNLFNIIKNIVPENKTFSRIYLTRCKLSTSNVEELRKNLMKEGIRTKPELNLDVHRNYSCVIGDNSFNHRLILMTPNRTTNV